MSTAEHIKTLREKTGAGLMACKAALSESNGDIEAAVVCLRKKGLADMAKRAGRDTNEGRVAVKSNDKNTAMVFLGCETDFVANTPEFMALAEKIADYVLSNPKDNYEGDDKIKAMIEELAPKFGENTTLKGAYNWSLTGGCGVIATYVHSDLKKACMLELSCVKGDGGCSKNADKAKEIARALAMQAVGMMAQYVNEADVPADVIEKEKDIATVQARNEGKPEEAIQKMLPGRINKFFKDVVLLDQPTIKDNKKSVKDYLAEESKEMGCELKVVRFVRF